MLCSDHSKLTCFLIELFLLQLSLLPEIAVTQSKVDQIIQHLQHPQDSYVLVAAHRGDWFWAPENSLQAFRNCIEAGVDMIELDVRLSKDSIPVIIHDLTLDRTTTGKGKVADYPLDSLKTFYLKDALEVVANEKIPSLEEVMEMAKDNVLIYLDKSGDKVEHILPILRNTGTLHQAVFVLDYSYKEAKKRFGSALDSVIFVPVVSDHMEDADQYVAEYLTHYPPAAFQFRMETKDGTAYPILSKVVASPSKAFVAATWPKHTIGHDDQLSRKDPDQGWGWLIDEGFTILETNRPYELLAYLRSKQLHD